MKTIKSWRDRPRYNKDGWHSRGYLPHNSQGSMTQFVTFRLADSLPKNVISRMDEWNKLSNNNVENKLLFQQKINLLLDRGYGDCHLKNQEVATMTINSFKFYDQKKYILHDWVIMPNHVHLLLTMQKEELLHSIIKSIKGYTGSKANKILNRKGPFWYREYYDRYIRNERHFEHARHYIYNNPVMAGLCKNKEDWVFSSYN